MMQHVATTKSEVAAFATGAETNSFAHSASNEQFGKVLQEQTSHHSAPQAATKNALQQPADDVKKTTSPATHEDTSTHNKSTSNQLVKTDDKTTSTLSKDKVETASNDDIASEVAGNDGIASEVAGNDGIASEVKSAVNEELNDSNTKIDKQLFLPLTSNQDGIGAEWSVDSATSIAEEWVTLVDNLKRLADNAQASKHSLVELEGHSLEDVSNADLKLHNKIEKELLEKILDKQTVAELTITKGEANLLPIQDNNGNVISTQEDEYLVVKQQAELDMSVLIGKVLSEGITDTDGQSKKAELLLKQPEVMQDLLRQWNILRQENDIDMAEGKTFDKIDKFIATESVVIGQQVEKSIQADKAFNNIVNKDALLASQKIEASGQTDLTLAENKALLKTLLVDSKTDKTNLQEPVKVAKPVPNMLPNDAEKSLQAQQIESAITILESAGEQDAQTLQILPNNILNSSKPEKVSSNPDIKNILNLTDNKLDKVLENIAQRVFESKKVAESISPEQIAPQLVIPKVAEIVSSVESSSKDFIAALKSGLEEFKHQLSQGREPGMDLKTLVADALAKTADPIKTPINLEQIVKSVSQVLDFAQTISRAIEHHHEQTYSATLRDVAQIQGEQSKQIQLNQFESKFEKAINIAKPEGHQQLAEKVRWMVNTKNLVAEIRLDPAELGSVNVKVAMSGESATVSFLVQTQQARDAVDNATPRLREMLAEKGIELGQSSVRQESDGQQGQGDGELAKQGGRGNGEAEDVEVPEQVLAQQNIVNGALGGIDYFV